jgi:hypothetical protein
MRHAVRWPSGIVCWTDTAEGWPRSCMSIPFTWNLPAAQRIIDAFSRTAWHVGGPAVRLMPDFLHGCTIGSEYPGVLQRVNPQATRTTAGCPNRCSFCGVSKICGAFRVLDDWPNLPVVCDDNLMAAGDEHLERVCAGLRKHGWADFNQGIDCRLMTPTRATMIASIGKPRVPLACDSPLIKEQWSEAVDMCIKAGIPKARIASLVLVGNGDIDESWDRCEFVTRKGIKASPMWKHSLVAMKRDEVIAEQERNGWTHKERRRIMAWYYKHRGVARAAATP